MWNWVKNLWNSVTDWLGRAWESFVNWLMNTLEFLWDVFIAGILFSTFGYAYILYVIFYVLYDDIIMEAWDSNDMSKPSERFKLEEADQNTPLPSRQNAQVHKLKR
ncbi:MAG: hypothetical protein Fur006_30900 [Coleofasciculaceae cyanobacterium]